MITKHMPKDYKKLLTVPLILFILCISIIGYSYLTKGYILEKSIDFEGGTEASVLVADADYDLAELEITAKDMFGETATVRKTENVLGTSINIQSKSEISMEDFEEYITLTGITVLETDDTTRPINIYTIGSSVSDIFLRQAQIGIIAAFIFMGIIVFLVFKSYVPSLAIISTAGMDILFAVTMMSLTGIELGLGSLAALLMLIGYSVDTDILLTTKLLRRKSEGTLEERIEDSMKTGITMTTAAIAAFIVLYLASPSKVLDDISLVIIFGLTADYITTWFQNVGILRWYLKDSETEKEKKEKRKKDHSTYVANKKTAQKSRRQRKQKKK